MEIVFFFQAESLEYGETLMTHAMAFTGVDICPETGKILKWRVENSHSKDRGKNGYISMSDEVLILFS